MKDRLRAVLSRGRTIDPQRHSRAASNRRFPLLPGSRRNPRQSVAQAAFVSGSVRLTGCQPEQFTGSQIGLLRLAVSSAGNTRPELPPSVGSSY
jgi:hypothetical protein